MPVAYQRPLVRRVPKHPAERRRGSGARRSMACGATAPAAAMRILPTIPIVLALWSPPAVAQESCTLLRFPDISVTFIRERPAVPVGINGRYVYFMLDTGFSKTSVTPETQSRFRLPIDPRVSEKGMGTSGVVTMPFASIPRFEFSGQTYLNPKFPVVALDQHIEPNGRPDLLSGAIGGDFLRNYEVELDFPNQLMRLYQRPTCYAARPTWTSPYQTIAMRVTSANAIVFPVQLGGTALKAVFDSGASSLVLALSAARSAGIDSAALEHDRTTHSWGAGGGPPSIAWVHPIRGLEIGGERIDRGELLVQDFHLSIADLLIGEPYIRSRKVWLSYGASLMFVQAPVPK
jgi:predicted aspartyl protease